MLAALLFGAAVAVSGICAFKDDVRIKTNSRKIDDKGRVTYYDRKGHDYINGERVVGSWFYDKDGHFHAIKKGVNTGTIYEDKYQNHIDEFDRIGRENKKQAIEHGWLGYKKYIPRLDCWGFAEVSTDKIIACLYEFDGEYRKFYWDGTGTKYDVNHSSKNDYGISITKEEYDDLDRSIGRGLAGKYPKNDDVFYSILYKNRKE